MKRSQVSKDRDNALMHSVEGVTDKGQNARDINRPSLRSAAFSLVELTLALGVAVFCLLVWLALLRTGLKTQRTSVQQTTAADIITEILADLRADVRLPPGQV